MITSSRYHIAYTLSALFIIIILCSTYTSANAQVKDRRQGIGVVLGDPTGLSYKNWVSENQAFDLGAAWSFTGDQSFTLFGDYLLHNFSILNNIKFVSKLSDRSGNFPLYFGAGARIRFDDDDTEFGIRIPVGVSYFTKEHPLELFGEVVPIVDLAPDTDVEINGGVGVRFYFK